MVIIMKISHDLVGKKVHVMTRYSKSIEGDLESIKNGVLRIKSADGVTTIMEGQVVAVKEIDGVDA